MIASVTVFIVLYALMVTMMWVAATTIHPTTCSGPACPQLLATFNEARKLMVVTFTLVAVTLPLAFAISLMIDTPKPPPGDAVGATTIRERRTPTVSAGTRRRSRRPRA